MSVLDIVRGCQRASVKVSGPSRIRQHWACDYTCVCSRSLHRRKGRDMHASVHGFSKMREPSIFGMYYLVSIVVGQYRDDCSLFTTPSWCG